MRPDLTTESLASIWEYAIQAVPQEACGIVVRERDRETVVPCRNTALDPTTFFQIEEEEIKKALFGPRPFWSPRKFVAIYHSHPRTAARPTPLDLKNAIVGLQYVIVSLLTKEMITFEAIS